jgi:hypothetical protein
MGYSIAIRASKELRNKLFTFMEKNYREPHTVLGGEYSYSSLGKTLSYDHSKQALGFDYNSGVGEQERFYIYAVLCWLALKSDKTMETPFGMTHYYVYDGSEKTPVLIESEWAEKIPKRYEQYLTDKNGFYDYKRMYENKWTQEMDVAFKQLNGISVDELNQIVKVELNRLDELWTKEIIG